MHGMQQCCFAGDSSPVTPSNGSVLSTGSYRWGNCPATNSRACKDLRPVSRGHVHSVTLCWAQQARQKPDKDMVCMQAQLRTRRGRSELLKCEGGNSTHYNRKRLHKTGHFDGVKSQVSKRHLCMYAHSHEWMLWDIYHVDRAL